MEIPRTKGYTEIVKIAEAAFNGEQEKARKYINKYLIKFPESDLVYPFAAILRGDLNPSGLNLCAQAEPSNELGALPIPDVVRSNYCWQWKHVSTLYWDQPCPKCGKPMRWE